MVRWYSRWLTLPVGYRRTCNSMILVCKFGRTSSKLARSPKVHEHWCWEQREWPISLCLASHAPFFASCPLPGSCLQLERSDAAAQQLLPAVAISLSQLSSDYIEGTLSLPAPDRDHTVWQKLSCVSSPSPLSRYEREYGRSAVFMSLPTLGL